MGTGVQWGMMRVWAGAQNSGRVQPVVEGIVAQTKRLTVCLPFANYSCATNYPKPFVRGRFARNLYLYRNHKAVRVCVRV